MAKLKYKDKDGFWQEFQAGTKVVANPILAGTEAELAGLQVGDTKYKMPASGGGKLYKHRVTLHNNNDKRIVIIIYASTDQPLTSFEKLFEHITLGMTVYVESTPGGTASISNVNPVGFGIHGVLDGTDGIVGIFDPEYIEWATIYYEDVVFEV